MPSPRSPRDWLTGDGRGAERYREWPDGAYRESRRLNGSTIRAGLPAVIDGPTDVLRCRRTWEAGEQPPTEAMITGHLFEDAILSPGRLADRYYVRTDERLAGKAKEAALAEAGSRLVVRQRDVDAALAAAESIRQLDPVRRLLDGADVRSVLWGSEAGLYLRGQVDALQVRPDGATIVDLKRVADASEAGLARSIRTYHLREQAALYRLLLSRTDGIDPEQISCVLLAVEIDTPPRIHICKLSTAALDLGERRIRRAIGDLARAVERDEWPMQVLQTVHVPAQWEEVIDYGE